MRCRKPKNAKKVFHVVINGRQAGPLSEAELNRLIKNGIVTADTLVWTPGLAQWTSAQYIPAVNKLLLLSYKSEKGMPGTAERNSENPVRKDMISAIAVLGYNKSVIQPAVDKVLDGNPDITLEEGIKATLKIIPR